MVAQYASEDWRGYYISIVSLARADGTEEGTLISIPRLYGSGYTLLL